MPRPREIADTGLFAYDFRHDGSRFWFLERALRPTVGVRHDGRFHSFGLPVEDMVELTSPGNVGVGDWPPEFEAGQIWILEFFTITSPLGDIFTGTVNGVPVGDSVTVAALGSANLLAHFYTFDVAIGVAVTNGGAGDAFTVRARRVS